MNESPPTRFEARLALFLEGFGFEYEGVIFQRGRFRALVIHSYSDYRIENTTAAMARAKIARAKAVFAALCEESPEFRRAVRFRWHDHSFCVDDFGKAGIGVARERGGRFTWYGAKELGG